MFGFQEKVKEAANELVCKCCCVSAVLDFRCIYLENQGPVPHNACHVLDCFVELPLHGLCREHCISRFGSLSVSHVGAYALRFYNGASRKSQAFYGIGPNVLALGGTSRVSIAVSDGRRNALAAFGRYCRNCVRLHVYGSNFKRNRVRSYRVVDGRLDVLLGNILVRHLLGKSFFEIFFGERLVENESLNDRTIGVL